MVDVTDTVRKAKKSESQDDDRRWHLSGAMLQQAKIVGQSENKVGKSGPNHETLAGCVDVQAVWTCWLCGRAGCVDVLAVVATIVRTLTQLTG